MTAPAAGADHPPIAVVAVDRCLACGSNLPRRLAMAYEYRGRRFPGAECRNCGMRFLSVQPAPDAFHELYDSGYFESDFRCGRSDEHSFDDAAFRDENASLLDDFARFGAPGRLLEVGCAGGTLLQLASERGWQARGVEFSASAVAHARARGVEVFQGDLIAAGFPDQSFDLVYMGDVLEHVPDCRRTLLEVARVLRPGGHLYLRGPITTHSLARGLALGVMGGLGKTIVLREPPYHLWEFTPGPLRRLLQSTGFDVVRWRESKIPPGRPHGEKSALERAILVVLDGVNVVLTQIANVRGDRVVLVARRR